MVFVRSSKVTNGWLVTIRDPESVIVTLQGYALQGYNGFLGVTHGYQFHWSLSRTLQMIHLTPKNLEFRGGKIQFATLENKVQSKIKSLFWFFTLTSLSQETLLLEIYIFFQQKTWFRGVQNTSSSFFVAKGTFFFSPGIKEQKLAILISPLLEPSSNQEEKNASHSGLARKSEKYFLYCAQVLYCSETKFCEVR